MIIYLFLGILLVGILVFKYRYKIKIKFKTFFKKGFKPNRGIFGVYCYCGKQGSGKTYSVVEFLHNNQDMPIYSNIKSIRGFRYTYIANFKEMLSLRDKKRIIIVYDELFSELTKNSTITKEMLDFLSQMRKREIICLTTVQEWSEIPLTWRRYCRYQIDCKLIRLPLIKGILIKTFHDAEHMKWSNDEQEHVAPIIETTVSHTLKWIADSYDTFEQIGNITSNKGLYEINEPLVSKTFKKSSKTKEAHLVEVFSSNKKDFWDDLDILNDLEVGGVLRHPPNSDV